MRTVLQDSGSAACATVALTATSAPGRRILRNVMIRSLPSCFFCRDPCAPLPSRSAAGSRGELARSAVRGRDRILALLSLDTIPGATHLPRFFWLIDQLKKTYSEGLARPPAKRAPLQHRR